MCSFVLVVAFMCFNPFAFPTWVLIIAWTALIIEILGVVIKTIIQW